MTRPDDEASRQLRAPGKRGISGGVYVVHSHFHPRRTGVTSHTEAVVSELARTSEVTAFGESLGPGVPRTTLGDVWRRAGKDTVVWHAHRNNELLWAWLFRALGRRLKLVFTRHGGSSPGWFSRLIMRAADATITLNDELRRQLPAGTTVVPHGIDLARFTAPTSRVEAWKALGLPGRLGVGVVGRIRPAKGQGDFVEALAPLLLEHPDVTPVLAGLARGRDQAWADALKGQLPTLVLAGEQSEVVRWYQGLDVVVQPSHNESFSLVIPEAMACGCVVIAARLPATNWLIEEGRTGFLFPPGDVAALRDTLRRVLGDAKLRASVSAAAVEEARARFGIEHEAAALTKVYESVLGGAAHGH